VPQWNGANSKTLKDGFTITTAGKALLDDANAAAQLTTLGITAAAQTILDDATVAAILVSLGLTALAAEINTLASSGITQADLIKLHAITAAAADINTAIVDILAATSIPTANTVAKFNASGIMKGAELNMTGETNAKGTSQTLDLDLGNVVVGDRILIHGMTTVMFESGTPSGGHCTLNKQSGTATITMGSDNTSLYSPLSLGDPQCSTFMTVIKVTGNGSLVLRMAALQGAGLVTITYSQQLYATYLKKS